jgi:hypothetical protein
MSRKLGEDWGTRSATVPPTSSPVQQCPVDAASSATARRRGCALRRVDTWLVGIACCCSVCERRPRPSPTATPSSRTASPIAYGIDAPESKQDCPDGRPAGRMATTRLLELTAGRPVVCEEKDHDRCGRTVAICRPLGEDLSAIIVREGMAWAFVRYSRDYVDQEAKAKGERLRPHDVPALSWCQFLSPNGSRSRAGSLVNFSLEDHVRQTRSARPQFVSLQLSILPCFLGNAVVRYL